MKIVKWVMGAASLLAVFVLQAGLAGAAEIKVISALGMKQVVDELGPGSKNPGSTSL